jgi:transcriptional regulator with GAF, ATPase, and Fis domain
VITAGGRPVALRIRQLRFEVVEGPDTGAAATLTRRELSVGTHPSNDLVLTDPAVSRFHLRVQAHDRGYRILDASSTNGTRVNGVRVHDGYLPEPARLQVGNTVIAVHGGDQESEIELSADSSFGGAIGTSVRMRELFAAARRVAATDATVLLHGETGTGKEVFARAIHEHSPRAAGPYVVLDCGATPATLIESVLFGHLRGAFTGADADHAGVFARASGGTLFLDEIGELPLALQPKLLRAVEAGVVMPLGGQAEVAVDVRIIAATHRDLRDLVERGDFRADLFYRLAVFPLELPPLRERPEDLPLLAGHFLRELLPAGAADPSWTHAHLEEAFAGLTSYAWPGNLRELRNLIERAVALADPTALAAGALPGLHALRSSVAEAMATPPPLEDARSAFDRQYLRQLLVRAGGDLDQAASLAGIHVKSLARLLRRHGLPRR